MHEWLLHSRHPTLELIIAQNQDLLMHHRFKSRSEGHPVSNLTPKLSDKCSMPTSRILPSLTLGKVRIPALSNLNVDKFDPKIAETVEYLVRIFSAL